MSIYTSSEWKTLWISAQKEVERIAQDLELKRIENDKDLIELSEGRLKESMIYRDDCKNGYYEALSEEDNNTNGKQNMITSFKCGIHGY